ncbi:LysM peptidoglycan-binding domain-containing M23 family metallopeptidase [Shimia sagamensis]|uniref:Murein DD-endopeptidase MepM and murein hydrolase activator NlpD, contain LysM domain n=1 Tax=Shimia sagamensis TaxID=1566352 RepID=A0ABY1PBV7_9RHOB|nr:LysM peptidoglycan-binding domain-containing M23 family metallopeptidase [Shimia sagamensis]SMP30451.1 Murein DD-endopeptidase MepM and murein hydrolase activator NlpD, contain LysM domain [Shimia sagamensis]
MAVFSSKNTRWIGAGFALTVMSGCLDTLDYDLRGDIGGGLDTTTAAQTATAQRPEPDDRGVISYPSYQVAVAKRGDTLADISQRVGIPAEELSETNGIAQHVQLREGEVITLPRRVAEPSTAPGGVDIASLAGGAINNADTAVETETLQPATVSTSPVQTGVEPVRHKVKRGETAFTIARLYNVSVRSLAEWNGLGSDFTIRENQILLIPPVDPQAEAERKAAAATAAATTTKPGEGSPTPTPPSASKPLPEDNTVAAATPVAKPESPNLNEQQSASKAAMSYPVSGKVIRPYSKGKNNGIDIAAAAGTPVTAAANGTVAAITKDADDVTILVVRHPNNLMTVYYNVDGVKVKKGASVKRGQSMAVLPAENSFVHFEVREGFDSVDPAPYLK